METLFNHKPTKREMQDVFGVSTPADLDVLQSLLGDYEDAHHNAIARLYLYRGDRARALRYFVRIRNRVFREHQLRAYLDPDALPPEAESV